MKARIRKIIIGAGRKESDRLIHELGNEGILHIARWDAAGGETPARDYEELANSVRAILIEIESLAAELRVAALGEADAARTMETPVIFQRDIGRDAEALHAIRSEMETIRELRLQRAGETEALRARMDEARDIAMLMDDSGALARMRLCSHAFGTLQRDIELTERETALPLYLRRAGRYVLGISLARDRDALLDMLNRHGFEKKAGMPAGPDSSPGPIETRIEITGQELRKREEELNGRKNEIARTLVDLHGIYAALGSAIEVKRGFLQTEDTIFMSGWIDLDDFDGLVSVLGRVCGTNAYVRLFTREEMMKLHGSVPVRLKNLWFFRAFERIVRNAGVPGGRELDPTPVATIAYLLMFGVMFGDIGQGLILCLCGWIMKRAAKRKGLLGFIPDAGVILVACGLSAALFGVLYGSVFSNEHLVPAVWFHPMGHIMDLFFAAIMMGASFISIGIIMNIINLFTDGEYFEAVFGKQGVLGFVVYAGSLFLAVRYIKAGIMPGAAELALILALPMGFFCIRNVFGYLFLGLDAVFPHGIFEYVIETFVEIMEMFSGFLGNSISFIRAGAFALSHAGLSIAVYTLAGIAGPIISAGALSIIVIGNIFIILLEGLVCGIQSMRLEYYEFFSKFYRGNGTEFAPFSFSRKRAVAKGVA